MHPEALNADGKIIFPVLARFQDFYLAGGTALALQIGHRVSVDFDLFSPNEIPPTLYGRIKKEFSGRAVETAADNPDELSVFVAGTKVTFLRYPFPLILESEILEGIRLLSVKEIAATKAYTIGRRGSFKDYVDLYFILKGGYAGLEEIIEIAEKKYAGEFNGRLFLEQLVYMDDVQESPLIFLKEAAGKKVVLGFFENLVKEIQLKIA